MYASWEAFKRQELQTARSFFFSVFALTWLNIMSSKDSVLKFSHCDASEAFACDLACTGDDELCEVHHCPVWLPVCSARRLELWTASRDESQPCPQCVHCRLLLLLICFRQHQGLQDYFFPLFSIVLYHAGLSIMYNLSYNIPPDSSPSQLHFNLMPPLSPLSSCILCSVWSTRDTTKVFLCCVRQMCFYI